MAARTKSARNLPLERQQQRCFDQDRYELSKGLKALIEAMPVTKVYYQTHESNFAIITMADGREYRVYFNVRRSSGKSTVRLYVESACAPDTENPAVTPKRARAVETRPKRKSRRLQKGDVRKELLSQIRPCG